MSIRLEDQPRQSEAVTVAPAPDGSLTVTRGARVVELNATAAALWALCDGRTTVAEIVTAATGLFVAPRASIEHDIVATLDLLEAQGLVSR